jgi:hypothetical protein
MKKYDVINDKFSQDSWIGTFDEIVEGIIKCNQSWGKNYTKDDFRITPRGIMCQDELIAIEAPMY